VVEVITCADSVRAGIPGAPGVTFRARQSRHTPRHIPRCRERR